MENQLSKSLAFSRYQFSNFQIMTNIYFSMHVQESVAYKQPKMESNKNLKDQKTAIRATLEFLRKAKQRHMILRTDGSPVNSLLIFDVQDIKYHSRQRTWPRNNVFTSSDWLKSIWKSTVFSKYSDIHRLQGLRNGYTFWRVYSETSPGTMDKIRQHNDGWWGKVDEFMMEIYRSQSRIWFQFADIVKHCSDTNRRDMDSMCLISLVALMQKTKVQQFSIPRVYLFGSNIKLR